MGRPVNKDILSKIQVSRYRRTGPGHSTRNADDTITIVRQQSKNKFRLASDGAWEESFTLIDTAMTTLPSGSFTIRARNDDGEDVFVSRLYNRQVRFRDDGELERDSYSKNRSDIRTLVSQITDVTAAASTSSTQQRPIFTTSVPHLLQTNDNVTIAGVKDKAATPALITRINGTFSIFKLSPTTFQVLLPAGANAAIGGVNAATPDVTVDENSLVTLTGSGDSDIAYVNLKS